MRKALVLVVCLASGVALLPLAHAHLCDDVWRQVDKLILKPEVTTLVVKDQVTFKVFMQHNMDRGFATNMRLIGESPAFDVTVTPEAGHGPPISPGQRYEYAVTLRVREGQRSGRYPLSFRLVGAGREIKTLQMGVGQEAAAPRELVGRRRVTAPELGRLTSPQLDGRLNEPCWRGALQCASFSNTQGRPAARSTQVLVRCDERTLYLGLGCRWPKAPVEGETDRVQVRLALPGQQEVCRVVTLSADGQLGVTEIKGAEESALPLESTGVKGQALQAQASWSAELAVPASLLGLSRFEKDTVCLVNFVRESQIGPAETSFWTGKPTDYLDPASFAELTVPGAHEVGTRATEH